MFGIDAMATIHAAHVKEVKEKELANMVIEWYELHKIEYCNEPEFVSKARELINVI